LLFDHRISSDRGADFVALAPDGDETILHIAPPFAGRPVVGDWVAVDDGARIVAVAPRRGVLARARRDRGGTAQPIAANLDVVFVVTAPGREFSPARVERYLVAIRSAGARAVVVLNKCDLARDPAALVADLTAVTPSTGSGQAVPVVAISAEYGDGCAALAAYVVPGTTLALVGSSGVGKSTLANRLLGMDRFATRATRTSDGRGVQTSTRRELVALPAGAWLVDTPGMRAFAPWSDDEALDDVFADVASAATRCRFRDCAHAHEPGCAVRDEIAADRRERWRALRAELVYLERREDPAALAHEKRRWKSITKAQRNANR
jgi:ribosome biogenesis GTPase